MVSGVLNYGEINAEALLPKQLLELALNSTATHLHAQMFGIRSTSLIPVEMKSALIIFNKMFPISLLDTRLISILMKVT